MDFRPSFPRPCRAEDYGAWDLTNLQVGGAGGRAPQAHLPQQSPPAGPRPLLQPQTPVLPGFWPLLGAQAARGSVTLGARVPGPRPVCLGARGWDPGKDTAHVWDMT